MPWEDLGRRIEIVLGVVDCHGGLAKTGDDYKRQFLSDIKATREAVAK